MQTFRVIHKHKYGEDVYIARSILNLQLIDGAAIASELEFDFEPEQGEKVTVEPCEVVTIFREITGERQ